jgi:hypothetical protein
MSPCSRDEELERFQQLERAVLSGRVFGGTPNRPQPGCALDLSDPPLDGIPALFIAALARNAADAGGRPAMSGKRALPATTTAA